MRVQIYGALLLSVLSLAAVLSGCSSSSAKPESKTSVVTAKPQETSPAPDLQAAMDKLQDSLEKPATVFHVSFKKSQSDGFSYQCEADVSTDGIVGKQTDVVPTTKLGNEVFPARTNVRDLKGTPIGTPDWNYVRSSIAMTYLNGHIKDAQEGVKYAGDEQTGGYDARRYDFDLANIDATVKKAMNLGNLMPGARQTKDYNVKGSAWIAKADGRMVKFQYDNIMTFNKGENSITHYEGVVTQK